MALAAFVAAVNRLQNAIDLEPILKHFGSSKRTLERELGFEALDLRLTAFIAIVFYTIPGLIMVALTAGSRKAMATNPKEDPTATTVIRLTNRLVASTLMYFIPIVIFVQNMHRWNPWTGGEWSTPLDKFQTILLHLQTTYYLVDTPYSMLKMDIEQIIHHIIGMGMAAGPMSLGKMGLPMMAVMFTEQGSSIWVRYTKIQRYFLPQYNRLERLLVRMNYYQNMWVMAVFINTPLLLRCAHYLVFVKQGIPLPPNQSTYFGLFVFLQLIYDWYWYIRLYKSFGSYTRKIRDIDAKKAGKKAM